MSRRFPASLGAVAWLSLLSALGASTATAQNPILLRIGSLSAPAVQGAHFAIPVQTDMSLAGGTNLAAISVTFNTNNPRVTLDSIKAGNFGVISLTTIAGVSTTVNATGGGAGNLTVATFFFTASATLGGTSIVLTPTAATSNTGANVLPSVRTIAQRTCIATSKWGDVNTDNNVNLIDAQQIARFSVGLNPNNPITVAGQGDATGDNNVNLIDAQQVARFSVGLTANVRINTQIFTHTAAALGVANVFDAAAGLSIGTPANVGSLTAGSQALLDVTATDGAGSDVSTCVPVTYSSSNTAAATVTSTGVINAVAAGVATITATSGAVSTQQIITVGNPGPIVAISNTAPSFTVGQNGSAASTTIQITNGGASSLTGITIGAPVHDVGAGGWLATQLSGTTAPATLTLTATPGALLPGTYHANIAVSAAGAGNSPANISVTMTIPPGSIVAYGTSAQKVKVVDIAGTHAPTVTVTDSSFGTLNGVPVTFTSRSSSVATVAANGQITAIGAGDAWIVASTTTSTDSVFVIVPPTANTPVLRTLSTTWVAGANSTTTITVVLDARGTTIGAASLSIGVPTNPSIFFNFSAAASGNVTITNNQFGVFRATFGNANGTTGTTNILTLTLNGRPSGSGYLTLLALDVSGVDGSDLTPITTSTRLPIVLK